MLREEEEEAEHSGRHASAHPAPEGPEISASPSAHGPGVTCLSIHPSSRCFLWCRCRQWGRLWVGEAGICKLCTFCSTSL